MQEHRTEGRWESQVTESGALLLQETSEKYFHFQLQLKMNWELSNNCLGCIFFFQSRIM